MTLYIIVAAAYIAGMPILLWIGCRVHKEVFINNKQKKTPRSKAGQLTLPKPLGPIIMERIKFTFKDGRVLQLGNKDEPKSEGVTNKQFFALLWFIGLIAALAFVFFGKLWFLFAIPVLFMISIGFSLITASPIIKGREKILAKMFEVGKSTLGAPEDGGNTPQSMIQILEWRELLKPNKVKFLVPTTFNGDNTETFMRQFNQVFGSETTWVAFNDPETGKPGWDFEEGMVTLKEMPPLPMKAPWSAHYVKSDAVAWSFFPIGLGVESGLELPNPETGEIENVLGFDVAGLQYDLAKEKGIKCSPSITGSPQALVAGGTGGGKSLATNTLVKVLKNPGITTKNEDNRPLF